MKNTLLVTATLGLLVLLGSGIFLNSVADQVDARTPVWHPCNLPSNEYVSVDSTTTAYAGRTYVVVIWDAPLTDFDAVIVCFENAFDNIGFEILVYHGLTLVALAPVTTTGTPGGYLSFPLYKNTCGCGEVPYTLQSGDRIVVNIVVRYGTGIVKGAFSHSGGYGFYV